MRLLGIVLLVGGFLIRLFTPNLVVFSWVLMGLGAVLTIVFSLTKKKLR
jgi:hypothetical protein